MPLFYVLLGQRKARILVANAEIDATLFRQRSRAEVSGKKILAIDAGRHGKVQIPEL